MTLHTTHTFQGQPVHIEALAEGSDTSEIELIPTGAFRLGDGRGGFTLSNPAQFIAASMEYARERSGGELLVDFDHGSERKGVDDKRTSAAGWITGLRHDAPGSRIMATVRWTAAGMEALNGRSYRFVSPVMAHTKSKEVIGVLRAGLTNVPAIGGMEAVAASIEDTDMNELLEQLASALGLEGGADETAVTAAALAAIGKVGDATAILTAAGIDGEVTPEAATTLSAKLTAAATADGEPDPAKYVPKAAFDELSQTVAALQTEQGAAKADGLVAAAQEAGKITPASLEWAKGYAAKDPAGFAAYVENAPVVCAAGELIPSLAPAVEGGLSDTEKAVCAATGISHDDFIANRDGKSAAQKEA